MTTPVYTPSGKGYALRYCPKCGRTTEHNVHPDNAKYKDSVLKQYECRVCHRNNDTIQGFSADLM